MSGSGAMNFARMAMQRGAASSFPGRQNRRTWPPPALPLIHFEVKAVERLNIEDAMEQARRDGTGKAPIVAHRRNFRPWLVTMEAETFSGCCAGTSRGQRGGKWD